jgi:hypothetical protein
MNTCGYIECKICVENAARIAALYDAILLPNYTNGRRAYTDSSINAELSEWLWPCDTFGMVYMFDVEILPVSTARGEPG